MALNLDLSGFSSNPFSTSDFGQQAAIAKNNSRAVIYLMKPYRDQFRDVALRPFGYHFDENFVNTASDILDLTGRGHISSQDAVLDLTSRKNLNDNMMPSPYAQMEFKASHLSDNWRFILVLTENGSSLIIGNTVAMPGGGSNQVRRIYTGYFLDEPLNPLTLSDHRRTPNPKAFMVITHKTRLNSIVEHGPMGAIQRVKHTGSENIANREIIQSLISHNASGRFDDSVWLMTPENCVTSVEIEDGYATAMPGATMDRGSSIINDILEYPAQNVGQVIRGMARIQSDMNARQESSLHLTNIHLDDDAFNASRTRNKLAHSLALPQMSTGSPFDLDVDRTISIKDLDAMVNGALDVIPLENERPMFYETSDQMEASMTNMYSCLIASVLPTILNSFNLNKIQFRFQMAMINGQVQSNFKTENAEPNWPISQDELIRKIRGVEYELEQGIFKTIFGAVGDFFVICDADTNNMTTLRLGLVEQGIRDSANYEFPSCLGGLVSPLIGNAACNMDNSSAIAELATRVTGAKNISTSFNQGDKDFLKYLDRRETISFGDVDHEMEID